MALDWSCGPLQAGLNCYRNREFFEAHEHWESVWLRLEDPEKSFLQALIQVTAAFHHLHAANPAGAISLMQRALLRLEICPSHFGGIAIEPLREHLGEWLRALTTGSSPRRAELPQIEPLP